MASLILRGDRNLNEQAIGRRIHCVPVLGQGDRFPNDRLIVDLVYQAVLAMRQGDEPTAPNVIIINLSLGNPRKPFYTRLSAWARLVDRLSHQFGILFLVSAGNYDGVFAIPAYASMRDFEDADPIDRAKATIAALGQIVARRKLLSPSESVNGLTIGAANSDSVSDADRRMARANVDPFSAMAMSNASSALGPGFAGSVKPDVLLPEARERLAMSASGAGLSVRPTSGMRPHGLKVAAPPRAGNDNWEHYTSGSSAAAALASRLSHQVHDALEAAYEQTFLSLPSAQRAVLLKAFVVHTAAWPEATADLIKSVIGPPDGKRHVEQRDNIRRFIGYGFANPDEAISCASDRATFWAVGHLTRDQSVSVDIPIPASVNGRALPHSMSATLAWFTPILSNRQSYRAVRLSLGEPSGLPLLRLDYAKAQPDQNQTRRGTIISRRWEGARAPVIAQNQISSIIVQRENDIGSAADESVPFGLAITFSMPGAVEIYDEVLARVAIRPQIPARP
jgi:Subtilase family